MSKLFKTFGWLEEGRTSRASRGSRVSDIASESELKSALTYEQTLKLDNISKMIMQLNERLQIALIIPQILENPKILGKSLKGTKYEPALKLVKEYREEKIRMQTTKPPEVNSSTNKVIDYFVENYEILKFLPDWVGDLDPNYQTLIKCLRIISQVARGRFARGALEQMQRELILQKLYNLNEQVQKDVQQIKLKIQKRKVTGLWRSTARGYIIYNLKEQLKSTRFNNQIMLKEEIMCTTTAVKKTLHQYNSKRKEVEEEVKRAEWQFQKKLNTNLSKEEEARAEKNKLVLQLDALIRRYDEVMFEKFNEEILLDEAIEKLQQELDDFQPEYNREEQIYIELVVKKEEEYQRIVEMKAHDFRRKHAAKKIQIWFRNIRRKMAKANLVEETLCDLIEALSENLKIALLIPEILENPQTICQCLKNSKYEQAIEIINDFLRDKGEGPQEEIPTYPDRATNSLIDYFINNSGILRYIPKVVKYLNQNQLKLLSYLEIIKNIAGGNLSKTSLAAMEMKSNINQTQHNNEDLKNYIEKTRREIEEMKSKQNVVQPPEPRYVKMPPYDDIEKAEIDTDEEIFKVRQYHAITEKDLVEKLKAERSLYEGNVKKNVGLEKGARAQLY
ncbi:hypothetical protein GQX74_005590 [Glossina fuscipes]|nr:hypothetical protein GQX74_005590 [Glossina fuscipes]